MNYRELSSDLIIEEIQLPPITQQQLIEYAGASKDFNPIHTIEKKAIEYGLPGVIAHGMLTMAFMGKAVSPFLERGGFVQDFHARFKAKVFVGDCLTVKAKQSDLNSNSDDELFHFTISVVNQHEKEVAAGFVTIQNIS